MPFRTGTVSYARFRVAGGPSAVDLDLLDHLAENTLRPPSVGAPPEVQAGWVGPRHVLDAAFDPDEIVHGERLLFGLRVDTSRVPAELRRAYLALAEQARQAEGFRATMGGEKAVLREEVDERCRNERASGRHQRSRMIPILWDVRRSVLLAPVFADTTGSVLRELFGATFDATLEPLTSGQLALEILDGRGRRRACEDLSPSPFTPPPAAGHGDDARDRSAPAIPWSPPGSEAPDFLGNEFLVWLWAQTEAGSAIIETESGGVAVAFDRALDTECAWGATGKQMLRADAPTRLPEAGRALQLGKWPRKAGLVVAAGGEQWDVTFQADRFLVTGVRLPRPESPPASPREGTEHRLDSIDTLDRALVDLYRVFLLRRTDDTWPAERSQIISWIAGRTRPAPAPAKPELVAS